MELTNDFEVAVSLDEAWKVLTDVERIAPCLPGARAAGSRGRRVPRHSEGEGRADHGVLQRGGEFLGAGRDEPTVQC